MNKYTKRYEELVALRMSASERLRAFAIGFFGDGFGLIGALVGTGGLGYSVLYYLDAEAAEPGIEILLSLLYAVGSAILLYASIKFIGYCHRHLSMAVSGVRDKQRGADAA